MAQIVVRNLEETVKLRLRKRAARHGRSMEEEVRDILRDAVKEEGRRMLGSEIARRFAVCGLDEGIPELRGARARPGVFEE